MLPEEPGVANNHSPIREEYVIADLVSVLSPVNQHFDNIKQEDTTKVPSQTVAADNPMPNVLAIQNSERSLSDVDDGSNIIHLEFSMKFRLLADHVRPLYKQNGNNADIWFNFRFD